jgi:hypothetical protein
VNTRILRSLTFVFILALAALLAACASGSARHTQQSLAPDIQAQLDSLQVPQGVDPQVFVQLKDELARQLALRGKAASTPPTGAANAPANVHFTDEGGGNYALRWEYRNTGDYDQNGTVGVADITPIAMHFGHAIGTDGMDAVIHPGPTGSVGVSDVTAIAMNYGVDVAHYVVTSSPTETGSYSTYVMSPFSDGVSGSGGWKEFAAVSAYDPALWYKVYPEDLSGNPGQECAPLQVASIGTPPTITGVSPQTGQSGTSFSPVVTYTGDTATYAYWDFGGGGAPDTITNISPTTTLGAAGSYSASVTLTNGAGSDTFNFTLVVTAAPTWNTYQLLSASLVGDFISFSLINGKPALALIEQSTGYLDYMRATASVPASLSDWASNTFADPDNAKWYTGDLSLIEDGLGYPVILAWDSTSGSGEVAVGSSLTPSGAGDWSVSAMAGPIDEVGTLAIVHGQLGATYKTPGGLYYAETTTYPPASPADWVSTLIDPTSGVGSNSKLKFNAEDDRLYVFSYNPIQGSLNTARCPWASRGIAGLWVDYISSSSTGDSSGANFDFGFDPAPGSNNMYYIYTQVTVGFDYLNGVLGYEGISDIGTYTFGSVAYGSANYGQMCSLAFGGGKVMCTYRSPDQTQLIYNSSNYTTNIAPLGWAPQTVPDGGPSSQILDTNLLVYNNTDVLIVYGRPEGIYFATLPLT